ncbi:phosphoribosyltransferase [Clostridium intestinale]|uniref:phosphoribosyltransferase n=1 Tax=Clostridium intestinale TaxID=36845 RepID=UPI002DD6B6F5|nr:phosphoribosyltransferase [Clostridium intestinale]WRY53906.1 phosphoribosyltransferase [Clostridium intestinale]
MNKAIIISTEVYSDLDEDGRVELVEILEDLIEEENQVCFVSRDAKKLKDIKEEIGNDKFYYKLRYQLDDTMKKNTGKEHYFVVLGNRDVDFLFAVRNKLLYLVPEWTVHINEKSQKYGIMIEDLEMFEEVIKAINNQNEWYYSAELPDGTKVYSLICAHSRGSIPSDEKEIVEGFEDFLKRGNGKYYKVLLCHFLASISNSKEFRDINCWGIMPSSGLSLNKDMLEFKERVRYFMGGKIPKALQDKPLENNIFVRNEAVTKSHHTSVLQRINQGATRHLSTININPAYYDKKLKSKLKGKNVCIFDDYLTHGNSFEALRNLLKEAGADKIIFVSLGKFRRDYIYQDYEINGDVFEAQGFDYVISHKEIIQDDEYNDEAREELTELKNIFTIKDHK